MKIALSILAAAAAIALSGCGQVDLTPEGDPGRVLTGTVDVGAEVPLPTGATVTVRVVDTSNAGMPPVVLGLQTITNPGVAPIRFRVEYRAEDEVLRRGLNVDARISFGGRVQYFNLNRYAVTLGNAADEHRIAVVPAGP
ncbi:MAG TPA: YbaY family lipoprotein [Opitutaceae bacterium]|nr:YbaY family lipoprotein [Opitutaceae bacterium]